MKLNRKGFTLVELMITIAIIAILAAIAIPNFAAARSTTMTATCQANARQIQKALDMACIDLGADSSDVQDLHQDVINLIIKNYTSSTPRCPLGTYSTDQGGNVMCSIHNPATGSAGGMPADPGE